MEKYSRFVCKLTKCDCDPAFNNVLIERDGVRIFWNSGIVNSSFLSSLFVICSEFGFQFKVFSLGDTLFIHISEL